MAIMFHFNKAALLSIQLLVIHHALAVHYPVDHKDIRVFSGDSVMFTCNMSIENMKQINWSKGRFLFAYKMSTNQTFSNFSQTTTIDRDFPSNLSISNVQHDDAGLYRCHVTGTGGVKTAEWNLMVSEKPEENISSSSSSYFLYILTPVIGLIICGITSAVCLCRNHRTRTPNQDPVQDQVHIQSGGEVVLTQTQADTVSRTNNRQRSQYMERPNSIYNLY